MSTAATFYCRSAVLIYALPKTLAANNREWQPASLRISQAASDGTALSSPCFGLDELVLSRTEPSYSSTDQSFYAFHFKLTRVMNSEG
jgi:hypothetical protein